MVGIVVGVCIRLGGVLSFTVCFLFSFFGCAAAGIATADHSAVTLAYAGTETA